MTLIGDRRPARLAGDEGKWELANSPSAHDCDDQVDNLKKQHQAEQEVGHPESEVGSRVGKAR